MSLELGKRLIEGYSQDFYNKEEVLLKRENRIPSLLFKSYSDVFGLKKVNATVGNRPSIPLGVDSQNGLFFVLGNQSAQ